MSAPTPPASLPVPLAPRHWVDHDAGAAAPPVTRAWLKQAASVAEVIFESDEGPPPPERIRWLCAQLDDFMARAGSRSRLVFRLALFVIGWLAPWLALRPLPFRFLSHDRRILALERLELSPLAPAMFAVKALLCILYYEHPDAAREIGFDGQCLETKA
ncbi:MAG: hypothetical protein R3F39_05185 [Myxococcota bacterium]